MADSSDGRISWDAWAMAIAGAVSLRGDCTRRQVGAVIISARHDVIAIGYNGVAPGEPGCLAGACPRGRHRRIVISPKLGLGKAHMEEDLITGIARCACGEDWPCKDYVEPGAAYGNCIATHAEMNALIRADHERLAGATMYVTCEPCGNCAKVARNTPLAQIIYADNGELRRLFNGVQEWARRERS